MIGAYESTALYLAERQGNAAMSAAILDSAQRPIRAAINRDRLVLEARGEDGAGPDSLFLGDGVPMVGAEACCSSLLAQAVRREKIGGRRTADRPVGRRPAAQRGKRSTDPVIGGIGMA